MVFTQRVWIFHERWSICYGVVQHSGSDILMILWPFRSEVKWVYRSNGYISSPWRSAICRCSGIPAKLNSCDFSFYEVSYGIFCNFSILDIFVLSFLAFFPVSFISVLLFPFWFLSSLDIVTSWCWDSFFRSKGNTPSSYGLGISVFYGSSNDLITLIPKSLVFNGLGMSSCSFIK